MTDTATMPPMSVTLCNCGMPATANGRECPDCFRRRLGSVGCTFAPTRSLGAGKMLGVNESRRWDNRLEDYRKVRAEGSQPAGTSQRDIDHAKAASDHVNAAVDAGPYARMERGA